MLCSCCLLLGYCRRLNVQIVSDEALGDPEFIRDIRTFAEGLDLTRDEWKDTLSNLYRDYRGRILDASGAEIFLDMDEIERASPYWFREFAKAPRPGVRPRVRREAKERVRVLTTILKAAYPDTAQFWGVRPANDNMPNNNEPRD